MLLVLLINSAKAQGISDFNNIYLYGEYGKPKGYEAFVQGGVYAQADHHYFKIKSSGAYELLSEERKRFFDQYHSNCQCKPEKNQFTEVALMYGKSYRILKHHQIQFGTGISAFMTKDPDDELNKDIHNYERYKYNKSFTVGLPAEVRYSFQFKKYFAISCSANLSANFTHTYGAISAGAAWGLF